MIVARVYITDFEANYPRMNAGPNHDADARREPGVAHRQGTEQGRQHEGGFRGEPDRRDRRASRKGRRARHAGDDGRQQHLATDRMAGSACSETIAKVRIPAASAGRPIAFAPFAVGSDQQPDSKGDREAHQA